MAREQHARGQVRKSTEAPGEGDVPDECSRQTARESLAKMRGMLGSRGRVQTPDVKDQRGCLAGCLLDAGPDSGAIKLCGARKAGGGRSLLQRVQLVKQCLYNPAQLRQVAACISPDPPG